MVTLAKEDKTLSLDFKSEDKTLIPILKLTTNRLSARDPNYGF